MFKMTSVFLFLNILLFWNLCESARIIAIMPVPSFSHQIVFQPLWKELLTRGHEVTLLTTDPIKDTNISNFKQIDWSFSYDLWHNKHNFSSIIKNFRQNKLHFFYQFIIMMHDIVAQELEHDDVQTLIKNESEYFDVAIVEFLHPTMLAFSERFKCPYIGVSSMDIFGFGHDMVGNPTNPTIYTDFLVPYDSKMNFFERMINTLHYIAISLICRYYVYPKEDVSVKKYFGSNLPKLEDIQKKVSIVFLNTHPVLHDARPLMPNVVQIGGAMHLHKHNALPQDLEMFLNNFKNGAIYFSLGSNVKMVDLPEETFTTLLETFENLAYGVVWKIDAKEMTKNFSNIFIGKWLPQQEILAHRNIKLFITQGGQQSLEEAIYYGVPLIGMPFYVDQIPNIKRLLRRGVCKALDPFNLKKEDLQNAIHEVLTNETYLNSMKELSSLLGDQPISNLDQVVWWTEYVIRHKGAKFLKSDVPNMPLYQYLLLDVIGVFILISVLILSFYFMLLRYLIKCIRLKIRGKKPYKLE